MIVSHLAISPAKSPELMHGAVPTPGIDIFFFNLSWDGRDATEFYLSELLKSLKGIFRDKA